jgi:anaerobic selenocysteine-containing dehydrogenase
MKRREFIVLTSVGATGATLLSACGHPEEKLVPALVPDEEYVPGIDYWKASTCGMCDAGCGIIVRTREHKANKIEGNPLHPVNRGALCARGQAGLEVLYNPDRIKGPLRRKGERGAGQWEEISWDEAIAHLVNQLRQIKEEKKGTSVAFAFEGMGGVTSVAVQLLKSAIGAPVTWADTHRAIEPIYDIANATYLLSFGARFLETWHSPVMYSLAYGEFRRSTGKPRGRFVQIEPRMSLTGANADEWLPVKPGGEGLIAEGIAHVIEREGLIKDRGSTSLPGQGIPPRAPEETADASGVSAEKVIRIAREFAAAERPLAIAAVPAPLRSSPSVDFLNALTGRRDKPGGFYEPGPNFDPFAELRSRIEGKTIHGADQKNTDFVTWASSLLSSSDQSNETSDPSRVLLIHHSNPVYCTPSIADSIGNMELVVSFSSFLDETTQLADLILPDHSYLERWDIQSVPVLEKRFAVSIAQPVVKPEFNTRQTADVLLAVSRELGLASAASEPFDSAESIVKYAAVGFGDQGFDARKTDQGIDSFKQPSENGVFVKGAPRVSESILAVDALYKETPRLDADVDFPLTLLLYEHPSLSFGEGANLPLLQELPDPMTSMMWGSWVEMHPSTAAELGIADGDLVEVTSTSGTVRLPAVLYRAIRPDVIAIPRGQGHTAYGRCAAGRGADLSVLQPIATNVSKMIESASGSMMTMLLDVVRMLGRGGDATARVKVSKAGASGRLIRFGTDLQEQMEKRR